jgi:purine-binding chemotaxis protein CheW
VTTSYLTFRMGARVLAAPLDQIREIVRAVGVETLAGVRAPVTGLLELRGEPLPVVDLRTMHDDDELGDVIVIAGDEEGPLGLAVDKVVAVVTSQALTASEGVLPLGLPAYVLEVLRTVDGSRPVFLVDLRVLAGVSAAVSPPPHPTFPTFG